MAQYFYDPNDDTVGSPPVGWTSEYETFDTLNIASDGTRNYVQTARTTNTTAHAISLDAVSDVADVEVFAIIVHPAAMGGYERQSMIFTRGSGTSDATSNSLMSFIAGGTDGTNGNIRKGSLVDGEFAAGTTVYSFVPTIDTPFAVRLRVTGSTTLNIRLWEPASPWTDPTADEPSTWQVEDNASEISAAGFVGWGGHIFGTNETTTPRLHSFGVGTGGDAAPSAAVSGLATPTNLSLTAHASLRQLDGSWTAVTEADSYDVEVDYESATDVWTSLTTFNQAGTTFTLDDTDGVDWGTTYRARVRSVTI